MRANRRTRLSRRACLRRRAPRFVAVSRSALDDGRNCRRWPGRPGPRGTVAASGCQPDQEQQDCAADYGLAIGRGHLSDVGITGVLVSRAGSRAARTEYRRGCRRIVRRSGDCCRCVLNSTLRIGARGRSSRTHPINVAVPGTGDFFVAAGRHLPGLPMILPAFADDPGRWRNTVHDGQQPFELARQPFRLRKVARLKRTLGRMDRCGGSACCGWTKFGHRRHATRHRRKPVGQHLCVRRVSARRALGNARGCAGRCRRWTNAFHDVWRHRGGRVTGDGRHRHGVRLAMLRACLSRSMVCRWPFALLPAVVLRFPLQALVNDDLAPLEAGRPHLLQQRPPHRPGRGLVHRERHHRAVAAAVHRGAPEPDRRRVQFKPGRLRLLAQLRRQLARLGAAVQQDQALLVLRHRNGAAQRLPPGQV